MRRTSSAGASSGRPSRRVVDVPAPPISRSASAASAGGSPMPLVRAVESSVSSRSSCALASSRSIAFASSGEVGVGVAGSARRPRRSPRAPSARRPGTGTGRRRTAAGRPCRCAGRARRPGRSRRRSRSGSRPPTSGCRTCRSGRAARGASSAGTSIAASALTNRSTETRSRSRAVATEPRHLAERLELVLPQRARRLRDEAGDRDDVERERAQCAVGAIPLRDGARGQQRVDASGADLVGPRQHRHRVDGGRPAHRRVVERGQEAEVGGVQVPHQVDDRVGLGRGVLGREERGSACGDLGRQRGDARRVDERHVLEPLRWPFDVDPLDLLCGASARGRAPVGRGRGAPAASGCRRCGGAS